MEDGARVGEPRRFDDQARECRHLAAVAPSTEVAERGGEIFALRAAQTPALEDEGRLVDPDKELVVDAHLAELVDQHREALPAVRAEQAIAERRLAAAEEPGDEGRRNTFVIRSHGSSSCAMAASSSGSNGSQRPPERRSTADHSAATLPASSVRPVRLLTTNAVPAKSAILTP